jgi:hypothetical protein
MGHVQTTCKNCLAPAALNGFGQPDTNLCKVQLGWKKCARSPLQPSECGAAEIRHILH